MVSMRWDMRGFRKEMEREIERKMEGRAAVSK
jgi:hypothetical protein